MADYAPARFGGDIGLAFLDSLPLEEARPLLQERRAAIEAELARVQGLPGHPGSLQLIFDHQRRHLQAELDWLDEVLQRITRPGKPQNS